MPRVRARAERHERTLVTTLTKRMAEDLTVYLQEKGLKVKYLHSEIHTIERSRILRDLRRREFDCLVGINLLREGLDLPEVYFIHNYSYNGLHKRYGHNVCRRHHRFNEKGDP